VSFDASFFISKKGVVKMANEDLRIKIIGTLDQTATITEINLALDKIENKISKLKLNVQLDDKTSKVLANFSKAMEHHKEIAKDLNQVLEKNETVVKKADGTTEKLTKTTLKSGEIIKSTTKIIDERTKALKKEEEATGDLIDEVEKLGKLQKEIQRFDGKGNLKGGSEKYKDDHVDTTYNFNKDSQLTGSTVVVNLNKKEKEIQLEKTKTKELQQQLDLYKRQAEFQLNKLRSNPNKIITSEQNKELEKYAQNVKNLKVDTPDLHNNMKHLAMDFKEVSTQVKSVGKQSKEFKDMNAQIKTARASSLGFADSLRTAFQKFPVWLAASTSIYGTIAATQNLLDVIISVDSAMVNLQKVMSQDTNFDNVMKNAEVSASKFAKTLTETLEAYEVFARQGYKENDLTYLGEAGLVASNVGEIDTEKAADYLTSSLIQWNKETNEAMGIVDSWNSISNNYATTVEKLAQGHAKAASTARNMGLSFDQTNAIIGSLTAATKQSGSEIGNFLKNTLPRLTSKPAQDALNMVGVNLLDSSGKMRNVVDVYTEVAYALKDMDAYNKSIVTEGLAGKYHISRMSAFLNDLASSESMYRQMVGTSENSMGSALAENEKYMQSLQARIQATKLEFEKMALAFGESFLTEGFIQTLNGLASLMSSVTSLTKSFGALPMILGVVGLGVGALSKNLNGFIQNLIWVPQGMQRATVATRGFSIALKGLAASTGIGLAFVAVGFALEGLLSAMGKARQAQEELKQKNNELMASFRQSKDDITSLTAEYEKLSSKINSGVYDNTDLERYSEIQNELARLMPNLVIGEDQYGNKVIASAESVKLKVQLLEQQLAIQNKLDAQQRKDDAIANYDTAKENLKGYEDTLDSVIKKVNGELTPEFGTKAITSIEQIKAKIEELEKKKDSVGLDMFESSDLDILRATKEEYTKASLVVDGAKMTMITANNEIIASTLTLNDEMSGSAKSMINDFSLFVGSTDESTKKIDNVLTTLRDSVSNDPSFRNAFKEYGTAIDEYKSKIEQGVSVDKLQEYKTKAVDAFDKVKQELLVLSSNGKLSADSLDMLDARLGILGNSSVLSSDSLNKLSQSTGKTKEQIMNALLLVPELAGEMDGLTESTNGSSDADKEKASTIERLLGLTASQLTQAKEMLAVYQLLGDAEELNATQTTELANAVAYLSELYPHLTNGRDIDVKAIQNEIQANEILTDAFGLLAEGKLSSENSMLLATAQASKARIDIMSKEMEFLQKLIRSIQIVAAETDSIDLDSQNRMTGAMKRAQELMASIGIETDSYKKTIDSLAKGIDFTGYLTPEAPKKDTRKDDKGSKSSDNKPPSPYMSSSYEKNLDKYNLKLEESKSRQDKAKESSAAYRKELDLQIGSYENLTKVADKEIDRLEARNEKINSVLAKLPQNKNKAQQELYNNLAKERDDNLKSITGLEKDIIGYKDSIVSANKGKSDSLLQVEVEKQEKAAKKIAQIQANYAATQAKFDKQIIDSQRRQSRYEVGSENWIKEVNLQNEALEKKRKFILAEREELKRSLREDNLSADAKDNLKKKIDELSIAYGDLTDEIYDNNKTLLEAREELADKIIDTVKKAIETERDLKLAAIDDEIDALEEAYRKKMDLIDKEESARDYNKDLSKMQKEQLSLQTQISRLSLDDSQEAKAKRLELQRQLAELVEQIEEKQHDRSVELQKESLTEQYDDMKDAKDKERKLVDRKYSEMLNDERRFAKLREEIIGGNLTNIQSLLGGFLKEFQSVNSKVAEELGISWQGLLNIIDAVKKAQSSLGNAPTTPDTTTPPPSNGGNTGGNGGGNNGSATQKGHLATGTFKNGLDAANLVDILQLQYSATAAKVVSDNGLFRVNAEFASLQKAEDVLKRILDRKLIATGRVFHEGGIVGGKGNRLTELANKLFNDPSGMLIKSLPGELQIPPKNIPNIFSSISGMISGLIPKQTASSGGMSFENLVHIENFNGTRAEIDNLGNALVNKLKNKGVL
jgi:TP901 family phage tail tape measure protein